MLILFEIKLNNKEKKKKTYQELNRTIVQVKL